MKDYFMNTYHRLPVTFAKGRGAWLFDIDGNKYLDFASGIAVNCLGHNYPPLVKAISEQAAKLNHTCNYYLNDVCLAFAEKLVSACSNAGMKNVFLANSGAEANEGACKLARKYSLKKYGPGRHQIVTLKGSFHGRTITTLAATGQDVFHKDFGPFTEGFKYVPANDIQALENALDKQCVAGLLIEAIQGESGIRIQSKEFIEAAAKLCIERDILLMFDEVQGGIGRTGTFLACEAFNVKPDIVTLAKGLCGGIPGGAVLAGEKTMDVFQIGDHGSTFGSNPIAAAAGLVVLETVNKPEFMAEIKRMGDKIMNGINSMKHPKIKEVRGRGLMIGIDITEDAWPILEKGIKLAQGNTAPGSRSVSGQPGSTTLPGSSGKSGLLMLTAGAQTLRMLPPYILTDAEIDEGLEIFRNLL